MALSELYRVLRVYVNFFQPSLKLLSKERNGAKVSKKYDTAKTPHQRFIMVESVDQKIKDALNEQYKALDPVPLLEKLKILQSKLFQYAWSCNDTPQETKESVAMMNNFMALPESKNRYFNIKKDSLDLAPKKRSFIIIDIARKMIATKDLETGKPEKILLNRYGTK